MRLSDVKQWILGLASASVLTQMVFAQAGVPAPLPTRAEPIILIQGGDKAPAAQAAPAVPAAPAAPDAKVDAPAANGNGNGNGNGEEKKDDEGPWRMFPNDICGFKITGWIYGTANYNSTNGGNTRYNGPMTMTDQTGAYLNQFYVSISRALKEEFSWGATVDTFYGNDYNASQSRGWELHNNAGWINRLNSGQDYGIVSPQSFVEVGTTKYSVKVGHFWTPIGYMVVQGPQNFFNTQPYGFMATNPFTHWGAVATATPNDHWSGYLGVVNGWDALDRPHNAASLLFGGRYTGDEKKWFINFSGITGQEPSNLNFPVYANRTLINTYIDYNFTDKFEYLIENNLLWQENPYGPENSQSYNFNQFFFYKINNCLKAGLRYEYMHDPQGFVAAERVGNPNNNPITGSNGPYHGNFQTLAPGLNWAPNGSKNLMIRPEVRYDWFSGTGNPYSAGTRDHQLVFVLGGFWIF